MAQNSLNTINLRLDEPVTNLPQVSKARATSLSNIGIHTVRDLLYHFPKRYLDLSHVASIATARSGQAWTIAATINNIEQKNPKPGVELIEVTLTDDTGTLIATFFRQKYLLDVLKIGDEVAVSGTLVFNYGFKRMTNPSIEVLPREKSIYEVAKIVPIHGACSGVSPAWMRNIISNALDYTQGMISFVPAEIINKYRLLELWDALRMIHFPNNMEEIVAAKRTLKYCEVLLLQLEIIKNSKLLYSDCQPVSMNFTGSNLSAMQSSLPYELTDDQQKSFSEIASQMSSDNHCNHLLMGDVGTGKTVLASMAIAACVDSGYQACLMVPTEVLAFQHYSTFNKLFENTNIKIALLTSSTKQKEREEIIDGLTKHNIEFVIGTHSLLQPVVNFKKLGLIVIDEQHRFGVEQRQTLIKKGIFRDKCTSDEHEKTFIADVINMSATPIPRSLSLALYCDMTSSTMIVKPNKVTSPQTTVLSREEISTAYDNAYDALEKGEQVFVICPLVGITSKQRDARTLVSQDRDINYSQDKEEMRYRSVVIENEEDFSQDNPHAAIQHADILQNQVFTTYSVEVLHGKMSADEKAKIMQDFKDKKIDVLVSTTVIEVGIDVPNATVMIIEDADRFGLAQLHQLRGRVGRGEKEAQVFLMSNSKQDIALKRLEKMQTCSDGTELACQDLKLRQEGDLLGNRQHGTKTLKLISVLDDKAIIETANKDAWKIINDDPKLENKDNILLRYEIANTFKDIK